MVKELDNGKHCGNCKDPNCLVAGAKDKDPVHTAIVGKRKEYSCFNLEGKDEGTNSIPSAIVIRNDDKLSPYKYTSKYTNNVWFEMLQRKQLSISQKWRQ